MLYKKASFPKNLRYRVSNVISISINLEDERTFTILNNVLMSSVDNHTMIAVLGAITVSKISVVNPERIFDNKKT